MDFIRSGACYATGTKYFCKFEITKDGSDVVIATLELEPVQGFSINDFEVIVPSGGSVTEIEDGFRIELDFGQLEDGSIQLKNIEGGHQNSPDKTLEVPHPNVFRAARSILEGHGLSAYEDWMKGRFNPDREGYHLIHFENKADKILKYKDYLQILSFLADYNPRFKNVIAGDRPGWFQNRAIDANKPNSATSFSDFVFKVNEYNRLEGLGSVDLNDIIRNSIDELYKRQRNSGYDYISHIIDRIAPIGQRDCSNLSRKNICLYASCYLSGNKDQKATQLLKDWAVSKNKISSEQAPSRLVEFEKDLREDENIESHKEYGEYLYYVGRHEFEKGEKQGTLPLFHAASTLLQKESELAIKAEFWARMRDGQRDLNSHDKRASESFDEAIELIGSINTSIEEVSQWKKMALEGKYRAIVNHYEGNSDTESAIQYLSQFVNDDLSDLDSDSALSTQVEGLRYDLISKENIKNGSIELARENMKKSIDLYSSSDLIKPKTRVYARIQLMDAYLDELQSEFQSAAEKYHVASEIYGQTLDNRTLGSRYSDIRNLCRAKSEILNENYSSAIENLESVTGSSSSIQSHQSVLLEQIELLTDYENKHITAEIGIDDNISTTRITGLVDIEFNYDESLCITYSSQYLQKYGVEADMLDIMIRQSLMSSFSPFSKEVQTEPSEKPKSDDYELLLSISLDEFWQSKLPTHIHYHIEQLKISEVTQAGDFTSLTNELTKTLEMLLVVFCEYYSKVEHGEVVEQINPLDKSALGSLIEFMLTISAEQLPVVEDLKEAFHSDILPNREITQIRNTGHHGEDIRYTKDQYEQLRDNIIDIFRTLSPHCPVIVEVEGSNALDMYLCVVHWGGIKGRVWLKTDGDLSLNELYYLPQKEFGKEHLVEISKDAIYSCDSERARNARNVTPIRPDED